MVTSSGQRLFPPSRLESFPSFLPPLQLQPSSKILDMGKSEVPQFRDQAILTRDVEDVDMSNMALAANHQIDQNLTIANNETDYEDDNEVDEDEFEDIDENGNVITLPVNTAVTATAPAVTSAAASPHPSHTSTAGKQKKKGKAQKFFCDDFPPCNLSFTRSEHLARHIRKHTGEKPFQCHCSRRFSRLDNLRQHAQTVHQNEEIPEDSLAATGTRFQRQSRTTNDRSRPSTCRQRGNTAGSQSTTGPIRCHKPNSWSTSSIGSASSVYSMPTHNTPGDRKRTFPPMVTSTTNSTVSATASVTTTSSEYSQVSTNETTTFQCHPESSIFHQQQQLSSSPLISSTPTPPKVTSTPNSSVINKASTNLNYTSSPPWATDLRSPQNSSHSRTTSDSQWPQFHHHQNKNCHHYATSWSNRRLSVPTTMTTFQFPQSQASSSSSSLKPPLPSISPCPSSVPLQNAHTSLNDNLKIVNSSQPMAISKSSPTTNKGVIWKSRDSIVSSEESSRRRTWHPDTYTALSGGGSSAQFFHSKLVSPQETIPKTSLNFPSTQTLLSDSFPPPPSMRLPGIESFGPLQRPKTPPRHHSSLLHKQASPITSPWQAHEHHHHQNNQGHPVVPNSPQWDQGINRNLHRLELSGHYDRVSAWMSDSHCPSSETGINLLKMPPTPMKEYIDPVRSEQKTSESSWQNNSHGPSMMTMMMMREDQEMSDSSYRTSLPISPQLIPSVSTQCHTPRGSYSTSKINLSIPDGSIRKGVSESIAQQNPNHQHRHTDQITECHNNNTFLRYDLPNYFPYPPPTLTERTYLHSHDEPPYSSSYMKSSKLRS